MELCWNERIGREPNRRWFCSITAWSEPAGGVTCQCKHAYPSRLDVTLAQIESLFPAWLASWCGERARECAGSKGRERSTWEASYPT
eukprot:3643350-Rhodomonas_salina.4